MFVHAVEIAVVSIRQRLCLFKDTIPPPYLHGFARAGFNTERLLTGCESLTTEIALEHDASANRQKFLPERVYADSSLALRYTPWADRTALGSTEAETVINMYWPFRALMFNAERAEFYAGRIVTMHAAARNGNSFTSYLNPLHE